MLNEGLLEKQVCLVTALKVSIATLKRLCKVFIGGWEDDTQLTHGCVSWRRTSNSESAMV